MIDAAIVVADRDGIISMWSTGATDLFGYAADEVVGRRIDVLLPDEFRARHWAGWSRAWRSGDIPASGTSMIPVRCSDGVTRRFAGQLSAIRTPHGEIAAAVAVWTAPCSEDAQLRDLV